MVATITEEAKAAMLANFDIEGKSLLLEVLGLSNMSQSTPAKRSSAPCAKHNAQVSSRDSNDA